MKTNFLPRLLT